jgi:hypothetical protein
MHGLRVYADTVGPDGLKQPRVFYSQRDEGPYYRWHYEETMDKWYVCRVSLQSVPKSLRAAHRDVPAALRTKLLEHYVE